MKVKKAKSKFVKTFIKAGFSPTVGYKIFKKIKKKGYITSKEVEKIIKSVKKGKDSKFPPEKIKVGYEGYTDPEFPEEIFIEKIKIETPKGVIEFSPSCYESIMFF